MRKLSHKPRSASAAITLQALDRLLPHTRYHGRLALIMAICQGDLVAATALLHLIAWLPHSARPDGRVYKGDGDWLAECGLDIRRIRRAYPTLQTIGLEVAVLPHATGRATHYRLRLRPFIRALARATGVQTRRILSLFFAPDSSDPSDDSSSRGKAKSAPPQHKKPQKETTTHADAALEASPSFADEPHDTPQDDHPQQTAPHAQNLYQRLAALGIRGPMLTRLALTITQDDLDQAHRYTQSANPRNPRAFLVACLEGGWHKTTPTTPPTPPPPPPVQQLPPPATLPADDDTITNSPPPEAMSAQAQHSPPPPPPPAPQVWRDIVPELHYTPWQGGRNLGFYLKLADLHIIEDPAQQHLTIIAQRNQELILNRCVNAITTLIKRNTGKVYSVTITPSTSTTGA